MKNSKKHQEHYSMNESGFGMFPDTYWGKIRAAISYGCMPENRTTFQRVPGHDKKYHFYVGANYNAGIASLQTFYRHMGEPQDTERKIDVLSKYLNKTPKISEISNNPDFLLEQYEALYLQRVRDNLPPVTDEETLQKIETKRLIKELKTTSPKYRSSVADELLKTNMIQAVEEFKRMTEGKRKNWFSKHYSLDEQVLGVEMLGKVRKIDVFEKITDDVLDYLENIYTHVERQGIEIGNSGEAWKTIFVHYPNVQRGLKKLNYEYPITNIRHVPEENEYVERSQEEIEGDILRATSTVEHKIFRDAIAKLKSA